MIEPTRVLRIVLGDYAGLSADLTFTANTQAVEDGDLVRTSGPTLISERTRIVQFRT